MMEEFDRHYELRLTAEPSRFGVVRRIVQAHLRHWDLAPLTHQTLLGLNELLANVYQHVGRHHACVVRLHYARDGLTVEVHDDSRVLPQVLGPDPMAPDGRGLSIVAGLCKEWGARLEETGKTVWFSLEPLPAKVPSAQPDPVLAESARLRATLRDWSRQSGGQAAGTVPGPAPTERQTAPQQLPVGLAAPAGPPREGQDASLPVG